MLRKTVPKIWTEFLIKGKPIQIVNLAKNRVDEAIETLGGTFYSDENLCIGCDMKSNPAACEEFSKFVAVKAGEGQSLIAVDKTTDTVIGLILNSIVNPFSLKHLEKARDNFKEENSIALINHLIELETAVDIFTKYNINCFLEVFLVSIDAKYRNQKIATRLILNTLEFVRSMKNSKDEFIPGHMVGFTTTKESFVAVNKFNCELVYYKPFSDFRFKDRDIYKINSKMHDQGVHLLVKKVY